MIAGLRRLLNDLRENASTGALHIDGYPGGVLYLVAGRIAYAETPACPTPGERLVACGRIPAQQWGRALLRDGLIGPHELGQRVWAAAREATVELLRSEPEHARFVPGERHWLGDIAARFKPVDHDAHGVRLVVVASPQDGPR